MATHQLCWPLAILFYCCSFFRSFFFRCLISEVARLIVTMFDVTQIYINSVTYLGAPPPGGPKTSKFRRDLIANISGTQQDVINRKTALQTTDTPAQANLIRCILVHKRRKLGPDF